MGTRNISNSFFTPIYAGKITDHILLFDLKM